MVVAAAAIVCHVGAAEKKDAPIVVVANHDAVHVEVRAALINTTAIQNLMCIKHAIHALAVEHRVAPIALEADIPGVMVAMARGIAMCAVAAERCNAAIVQEVGK